MKAFANEGVYEAFLRESMEFVSVVDYEEIGDMGNFLKVNIGLDPNSQCQYASVRYCRIENFRENFILENSIKRHISDVKNSRLSQDLPISINDIVILPFRECFIFTKLCICKVSQK